MNNGGVVDFFVRNGNADETDWADVHGLFFDKSKICFFPKYKNQSISA
jgi:hypothetical protein